MISKTHNQLYLPKCTTFTVKPMLRIRSSIVLMNIRIFTVIFFSIGLSFPLFNLPLVSRIH